MLDIRYESSAGVSVALNSGVYVGRPNDLFSREWDYKIGYRALATASRGARKVSFKAFFADMAQADAFRRCADADMQKGMPGTLRVEGWFQRCFVVSSEVDGIGPGFFMAKLTLVLLDGVWRRESTTAFSQVSWSADYEYLDLPYDLPYDRGNAAAGIRHEPGAYRQPSEVHRVRAGGQPRHQARGQPVPGRRDCARRRAS